MNIEIWNKNTAHWETIVNVKRIYLSTSGNYFKLDNREFSTSKYDIQFIYDSEVGMVLKMKTRVLFKNKKNSKNI